MAKLFIGTSGWTYASWKGKFYPVSLAAPKYLEFYSEHFNSTEVNYSFYHLPKPSTYLKWKKSAPAGFLFALKASRFITHTKKLLDVEIAWNKFLENALVLSVYMGPILFQFPASFRLNIQLLDDFLTMIKKNKPSSCRLALVFEFRHPSWFRKEIYDLLSTHGAAICIADSPKYPRLEIITSKFAYFRYHGRTDLFASSYSKAELKEEALKIKKLLKRISLFLLISTMMQKDTLLIMLKL